MASSPECIITLPNFTKVKLNSSGMYFQMAVLKFLIQNQLKCLSCKSKNTIQCWIPTALRISMTPAYNFHSFQTDRNKRKPSLLKIQLSFAFINDSTKKMSGDKKDSEIKKSKKRVPKLILLQNPFSLLMTKIDFQCLKSVWDPSFKESEFKFGTRQAISRVSQVISDGRFEELNGLLTKAARLSLLRELDRNWSPRQRALLSLQRDDIQISSPRKVHFIRIADKKFCDVDMTFLALKWMPIQNIETLLLAEIFARFHREYTPFCIPEWTIAYFKVTRLEALRRKAKEKK